MLNTNWIVMPSPSSRERRSPSKNAMIVAFPTGNMIPKPSPTITRETMTGA